MATNEATWWNKGTLSKVLTSHRNSDDRTEVTHHILEDIKEENLETLKNEKGNDNAQNSDTNNEESQRIWKLTEKGEEEKIRRLKQWQTNALKAVSRKRTDINKLMTDCRNLGVVKAELNQFTPLSRSTMLRILSSCSATVRRSLHGLDYIAADCGKAFDELIAMLPKLSSDCTWVGRWQRALMEAKQYIKSDYKTMWLYVTYN